MSFIKLMLLAFIITSCTDNSGGDAKTEVRGASNIDDNGRVCFHDVYPASIGKKIAKIDIAIVVDTSGSMTNERLAIANQFDSFTKNLPEKADLRIAVILAHGDKTGHAGKLYQKNTEPRVLNSKQHTIEEIKSALKTKLQNPATDNETDGGEVGLYSLVKSFDETEFAFNQSHDFYREDAALSVLFIADEQDICAEYPAGVIPVVDPQKLEEKAYQKYCLDQNGENKFSAEKVFNVLKNKKGDQPVFVNGIVYNNLQTIPHVGENELAYGILELIEYARGQSIDLVGRKYEKGLAKLGHKANSALSALQSFTLQTNKVDPATIEVFVKNNKVEFTYDAELNLVSLIQPRATNTVARLKYCEKEEFVTPEKTFIKQLALGGSHSCALLSSGDVKCWGRNNLGQLGLGHSDNIGDDESVADAPILNIGEKVIDISAGFNHTCVVLESGNVKCWGENLRGQLGQGHTNPLGIQEHPIDIPSIPLATTALKIYSGTRHSCALLSNKKVQCWGDNTYGQLGYAHTEHMGDNETLHNLPFVQLGQDVMQMDISTISNHNCVVLINGQMRCWGRNNAGQLGLGHTNNIGDNEHPSSVATVGLSQLVLQIATGNTHTCAVVAGGDLYCFGANNVGQIAGTSTENIGDNESLANLQPILTGADSHLMTVAGNLHTCTLGSNYSAYCFGQGQNGALGLGHTQNVGTNGIALNETLVPLQNITLSYLAAGSGHSCAISKDEAHVFCWGLNDMGQLGLGHTQNVGTGVIAISKSTILASE
jgi:alpha-tubulin suppressor-like RCC1 family protein